MLLMMYVKRSGSTLGGIAFSRVGDCTELGEKLDRVSGGKGDFSLFRWFFEGGLV
jgi:hypothetical protein